jgi:hypothetical protein
MMTIVKISPFLSQLNNSKLWFQDEVQAKAECNFVGVANFQNDATTEKIVFWWSDVSFLFLVWRWLASKYNKLEEFMVLTLKLIQIIAIRRQFRCTSLHVFVVACKQFWVKAGGTVKLKSLHYHLLWHRI